MTDSLSYDQMPGARWQPLASEVARERYSLLEVSDDSIDYDELTGGDPIAFHVHPAGLAVAGPLWIRNEEAGHVFIIEGDLAVEGPLVIGDHGRYVPLWIKGNLTAASLAVLHDAHVFIEGDLRLAGELVTYLGDAGHLVVHGELTAAAWARMSTRGAVYLPESTPEPLQDEPLEARLAPAITAIPNRHLAISDHVLDGLPVIRSS